MPKADTNPTPNPEPSPQELFTAALAAATQALTTCPSVLALGQHLAGVEHANAAFEEADQKDGPPRICVAANWATDLLTAREDALRALIITQPAVTMADAAVQIAVIAELAANMGSTDRRRAEAITASIESIALGMLPIIAAAAGLDLERMNWTYPAGSMRVARFGGLGVVA